MCRKSSSIPSIADLLVCAQAAGRSAAEPRLAGEALGPEVFQVVLGRAVELRELGAGSIDGRGVLVLGVVVLQVVVAQADAVGHPGLLEQAHRLARVAPLVQVRPVIDDVTQVGDEGDPLGGGVVHDPLGLVVEDRGVGLGVVLGVGQGDDGEGLVVVCVGQLAAVRGASRRIPVAAAPGDQPQAQGAQARRLNELTALQTPIPSLGHRSLPAPTWMTRSYLQT